MEHRPSVFLLGVFDMFHQGHLNLIEKACELGNVYIGVVCDEAVSLQKGPNRPVITENQRKDIVGALKGVCGTMIIKDFHIPQFVLDKCDIIVVGADQAHIKNLKDIPVGKRYDLPRTEGVSTSDIVKKIKES
jgi:cytidyltransferase-like protein